MKPNRAIRARRLGRLSAGTQNSPQQPERVSLRIEYLAIDDLRPYQNNPRLHPKTQIDKLAHAISDFGFLIPILVDVENAVLAGHARIEAAKKLRLPEVPCIRASRLTEAQKRPFTILDNRLAEDATWDFQLLTKEIEFLTLSTRWMVRFTSYARIGGISTKCCPPAGAFIAN
jgi:hypothetical protein